MSGDDDEWVENALPCCLSFGMSSEQNPRFRRTMEDAHVVLGNFGGHPSRGFVGIYDGHGGSDASKHVATSLHKHFLNELRTRTGVRMAELIARAYVATDKELETMNMHQQGSTAVTCYIAPEGPFGSDAESRVLYTANAGDARAVLCRGGKALRLSYDHKAGDDAEAQRVQESGGFIVYGRVNAILSVTRSLGDHALKQSVLPYPHTSEVKLTDEDEFVIVACDGLWDVLSDQDAVNHVRYVDDGQEMSRVLLRKSLDLGTTDNVSIICFRLKQAPEAPPSE
eukprot:c1095_g1_i1.p1 GENE.c1095_g1_i1~~c1095_g1_i1.p1  ORF type:complete len:283 (+),score=68.49 c1095_g1_i1:85-933(+)